LETTITEIGKLIANPTSEPLCVIVFDEIGYKKIHISFISDNLNTKLDIQRTRDKNFSLVFNSENKSEISFQENEFVLFDGPNPMFDYINTVEILKMGSNDSKKANVKIIDWSSGAIEPIDFVFKTEQKKVVVDKGDENFNATFYLDDSTLIRNYTTKHEEYEFELVENK
jgi:hypothetical protein